MAAEPPILLIVAGPNGSGKTTLTNQLRDDGVELGTYINADDIARSLEGNYDARVREAQRLADEAREACIARLETFTFETVMSHPSKIAVLERAKGRGFRIGLYFVATESADLNVDRVRQRVALGGHQVAENKIRERYERTLKLLPRAMRVADRAVLFDNSGRAQAAIRPFCQKDGDVFTLEPPIPAWSQPALGEWLQL